MTIDIGLTKFRRSALEVSTEEMAMIRRALRMLRTFGAVNSIDDMKCLDRLLMKVSRPGNNKKR